MLVALRDQNDGLLGFGKILRNRTDLREQLEALRNQVESLAAADKKKNNFLATLSHELRNPLASICTAVELIGRTLSPNANVEASLKIIEEQLDFVRRMLDDLLDVTRISTGKVGLKMRPVMLHEVIDKAVEAARPWVEERSQNMQVVGPRAFIAIDDKGDVFVDNVAVTDAEVAFTTLRGPSETVHTDRRMDEARGDTGPLTFIR